MKTNDVFAADSDSLAIDIACYEKLFADFIQEMAAGKQISPEITGPILEASGAGAGLSIYKGLLYAFVAGMESGLNLAIELPEKPNQTIIE